MVNEAGLSADKNGVLLAVRVKPRGSKNEVVGWRNGALVVVVTAAPSDGAANAAVIEVLAGALRCPKSTLMLARGHKSRDKQVRLLQLSLEEAHERLQHIAPLEA
jgi:uncharacterized protein (TIGR00251 family)